MEGRLDCGWRSSNVSGTASSSRGSSCSWRSVSSFASRSSDAAGGRGNSHYIVVERKELVEVVFVWCLALSAGGATSWSVGGAGPPGQLLHYRRPH